MDKLHPKDAPSSKIRGRHKDRLKQSLYFVLYHTYNIKRVLSIGGSSVFDTRVFNELAASWCTLSHTIGDLDTLKWYPNTHGKFNTVFCFEIMEHILNPRLFLEQLAKYLTDDAIVFISIPNHFLKRHWRTLHYHEIDKVRFEYLCDQAGYKIIDHRCYKYFPKLRDITGIRPLIRYITGYSWFISRTDRHFYAIRKKAH